jgi:rubrerythrin
MKSLKKTTFLEAVAAAIEHEVKSFNFFLKLSSDLSPGPIQELFDQLASDGDRQIEFIKDIYKQAEGKELPNLKTLSIIHKFQSSTIQLLMEKLERNMNQVVGSNEQKAMELAVLHGEDTKAFYRKVKDKFPDPKINLLFNRLLSFTETNTSLIEAQILALGQSTPIEGQFFWEDESLLLEATSSNQARSKNSPQVKSKKSAPPAKKKKLVAKKKQAKAKKSSPRPAKKVVKKSIPKAKVVKKTMVKKKKKRT